MKPSKHSAGGPIAGSIWQVRLGLVLLLQMDVGGRLTLEIEDDLAHISDGGTLVSSIQAKHSLKAGSLGLRSVPVWKTLSVWLTQLGRRSDQLPWLTLATTQDLSGELGPLSQHPHSRTSSTVAPIKDALDQVASDGRNKALAEQFAAWLNFPEDLRLMLLARTHFRCGLARLDRLSAEVRASVRNKGVAEGHLDEATARLEKWYIDTVSERLGVGGAQILHDEFIGELEDIHRTLSSVRLAFQFSGEPIEGMNHSLELKKLYQRQLALLDVPEGMHEHAYEMYHRARLERQRWLRKRLVGLAELKSHDSDLVNTWRSVSIFAAMDSSDQVSQGRLVLKGCCEQAGQLKGVRMQRHVHEGSLHILANQQDPSTQVPQIGWHPRYQELLGPSIEQDDE